MRRKPPSSGGGISLSGGGLEMLIGVLLFLAGGGLTTLSYQSAEPGGRFVIFTGAIIWGMVHMVRGFFRTFGE